MADFTKRPDASLPTWTAVATPNGNFSPKSATGQNVLSGGYGLGTYGGGGFGIGDGTSGAVVSDVVTTWTRFTGK